MTKIAYYPGCALKERASHLDRSARESSSGLGFELDEIEKWTCCGAVPPVSSERVMNLLASSRILKGVRDSGRDRIVTICDFCYNTLKRTNYAIRNDELVRRRINSFLADDDPVRDYDETSARPWRDYSGEVEVNHLLEYLRDVIGFEQMAARVTTRLEGLSIAPYYGCVMLRPEKEIRLDSPENPVIIDDFLTALGAGVTRYPFRTECCGSYLSVSSPEASTRLCHRIISSAREHGAHALAVSCPLCFYNLDSRQAAIAEAYEDYRPMPVFYFTQLLSLALGNGSGAQGFERHHVDVTPALERIGAL